MSNAESSGAVLGAHCRPTFSPRSRGLVRLRRAARGPASAGFAPHRAARPVRAPFSLRKQPRARAERAAGRQRPGLTMAPARGAGDTFALSRVRRSRGARGAEAAPAPWGRPNPPLHVIRSHVQGTKSLNSDTASLLRKYTRPRMGRVALTHSKPRQMDRRAGGKAEGRRSDRAVG